MKQTPSKTSIGSVMQGGETAPLVVASYTNRVAKTLWNRPNQRNTKTGSFSKTKVNVNSPVSIRQEKRAKWTNTENVHEWVLRYTWVNRQQWLANVGLLLTAQKRKLHQIRGHFSGKISSKIPTAPCNDVTINTQVDSRQCINWVERDE